MHNVNKFKNLLVSSCQAIKDGHRDIGVNLLELAADLMEEQDISPEVIETQFITAVNDNPTPTEFESASEETVIEPGTEKIFTENEIKVAAKNSNAPTTEEDDAEAEEASHLTFRDIIDNWGIGNVAGNSA